MPEREYRRLTRARRRSGAFYKLYNSRASLWLGTDHILFVDIEGFTETYRRFYFRDIQMITMRTTRRRAIWNAVFSLLLLLFLAELTVDGFGILSMSVAAILGFFLLLNNVLGTTCRTYFHTAVQKEEIPSLSRVRRTQKVLERIRPLVAAAQGLLTPEEAAARLKEMSSGSTPQ